MYHQFKELGDVDITKESMEVGPTAHYTMGGIRVDPETQQSRIEGLFAAGECAAGMHGANRLGGNSLSDLLVFGRIAGLHAAKYAKNREAASPRRGRDRGGRARGTGALRRAKKGRTRFCSTRTSRTRCRSTSASSAPRSDLKKGLEHIERIAEETGRVKVDGNRHYNSALHQAFDMRNMLIVSEAMARAALARKESRGGHAREDFPDMDKGHFAKVNIVAAQDRDRHGGRRGAAAGRSARDQDRARGG